MDAMKELSYGELSALCSNLAKACEKQQLFEQQKRFLELADYYVGHAEPVSDASIEAVKTLVKGDLESGFGPAFDQAHADHDRGALRALTWSQKATALLDSLLKRYDSKGDALVAGTSVYVCEICGFIFVGDNPPDICPICKVPKSKIIKVRG
ncbi:rubredoxin-like domain-containing protein [Raoultibacter phocaeensis]|uniref:rubredoxin-like domain-containing protein n=1 Tax=Raoultibacter phocaeensis TaxID=2479841 RepID=UPI0011198329|nr:rubredoxin [Raoultibacter phocaeensis]